SGEDRPGALVLLLGVIAFRSVAWFGLVTFVPLYEVSLGHSKAYGSHLLSLMLLAGGLGTLAAGPIADRIGRRPVLVVSMLAVCPLTLVYVLVGGVPGAIALALVGVCVIGTFGVTMVMSQEYLPRRIGMASGLSIGLSIGLGGIAAVALGAVADGKVTVAENGADADCVISTTSETFLKIANREQNPTAAYMSGKLKIKGDMGQAMKLQKLF